MEIFFIYLATAVSFLILDVLWLGFVAKSFYFNRLRCLIAERPNFGAAALFYIIYIAGILIFVVEPANEIGSISAAAIYGSLFGFIAYSTFDLTNLAIVRNWSVHVAVVDVVWGAVITSVSSTVGFIAASYLA